jgi:hypothetical protein
MGGANRMSCDYDGWRPFPGLGGFGHGLGGFGHALGGFGFSLVLGYILTNYNVYNNYNYNAYNDYDDYDCY